MVMIVPCAMATTANAMKDGLASTVMSVKRTKHATNSCQRTPEEFVIKMEMW